MAAPRPRGHRPDEQAPPVATSTASPSGPPSGPPSEPAAGPPSAAQPGLSPAEARALTFTARNMVWSLLPLTVLILVAVGWTALRQPHDPVHEVETRTSIYLAAQRADYPLLVPQGLSSGWRATSVHTDAGAADTPGDPVTLQIGWYTPGEEYAGYVISDGAHDSALTDVLNHAKDDGTAQVDGQTWQRRTTARGETALTRSDGPATVLITGSASEEELEALAAAVGPYRAP